MKKFTITLTLADQDAERLVALWDKTDLSEVVKKALEEFCIDRYDAERFVFEKWGLAAKVDDKWKDRVAETKFQYQAAKLLVNAEMEEEVAEGDLEETDE